MERLCVDDSGLRLLGESRDRIGFLAEIPSCPRRPVSLRGVFFEREEDIRGERVIKVVKAIKDFKVGGQRQTKGCESG